MVRGCGFGRVKDEAGGDCNEQIDNGFLILVQFRSISGECSAVDLLDAGEEAAIFYGSGTGFHSALVGSLVLE